ncbi:hypothetical protein GAP32_499 [Cronobacter phage vB_CsaM_GAP32]|uniref:Uncharacterized protein n=1 Tax=Cronobacter phage vB_CsaM_GAP32 TaxID=1141136 RepID=K4F7B2_9CAUD|nr:hypothetical protein GAP32_499 [Cronobacter phage vB_CsaM_GAP32]AFC21958.1 hypothetical protein GAP32_499 [Cronobacter phage vB_CsaM_GAP32]
MISQYMVDRLKEKGFHIISHDDSEVVVKGTRKSINERDWTAEDDVPLYSDREIRRFLEVHG